MKRIQLATTFIVIIILATACSPVASVSVQPEESSNIQTQPSTISDNDNSQTIGGPVSITIQGFAFSPDNITVKVGTQVTWTNLDTAGHTATALDSSFDSGILINGETSIYQFDQPGTFEYNCTLHPYMRGVMTVVP
jgi:plastocyanin